MTEAVSYFKNITNKGDITNIVGIDTYLLVHTEKSLFAFNVLKKSILIGFPEIGQTNLIPLRIPKV